MKKQRSIKNTMTNEELRNHKSAHDKTNSWWLSDVRGIPVSRVCDKCINVIKSQYKPEVFGEGGKYEDVVEEQIEEEY